MDDLNKPDSATTQSSSPAGDSPDVEPEQSTNDSTDSSNAKNIVEDEIVAGELIRAIATTVSPPNIQPNHQATTLLFSLIEGRCKSQARSTLNSRRHSQDQLSEDDAEVLALADSIFKETLTGMKKAGLIPKEVAIPGAVERRDFLKALDTRLKDIAIHEQPPGNLTYDTFENSERYSDGGDVSSLFERSQSQLQPRSQVHHPLRIASGRLSSSPLDNLMYPSGINALHQESPYYRKFREICLLGKGGFGQVFRARHNLDDQEYAIKQIRVSASQLRSIHDQVQLEHLLKELRALAKLQHRNVVRYYDSWCELRPASWRSVRNGQRLLENGPDDLSDTSSESSSSESQQPSENFGSVPRDIQIENEIELRRDIRKTRRDSFRESSQNDSVIFEYSYDTAPSLSEGKDKSKSSSAPRSSLFRKPSEMSDDEESTEEIRNENLNRNMQYWEDEKDMLIFIQMAPYPFTLEDFVWSEQQKESDTKLQHCFHWPIAAQLLLAILDGVEYIHGHDIVHRDLKPSNIFLSIHRGHYQPEGSVNITACTHCTPTSSSAEQIFLTPHIGDFGLIAKIESSHPQSENTFHPSPIAVLSSVASSRQPGTKFYCAPQSDEISPKLDVYSLGVIACELLVRFGTRSERMHVLNDVNAGRLDVLAGCELERGVRGMLEHEKERRWGCGDVRRWVGEVLGGGGGA